ncbi:PREDICTED: coatomer subunit delta-like isoform X1 [Amphimedon queenslandica]|uniref:Coatomer subunit delta n=2 Tax=Amphimedon queenslandica TaxID=400682 RepID=A0AAN0J440_AMPQE|nr:PREDICTED: coatomer subunit delta-like isoform X1 [Amphimedon queenslandica]|eukprot:XP_019851522.1 PREDICTED: coatomer subunit delta-like isoform X1 [Amphimedon queenslandica]
MVLLAAAICTKQGKALISRQFVEMTRSRIEGLLASFPKLMNSGHQHTFVETESVRYVYQPLEQLYMLLITTTTSNILEDLETLRLFSRVIPEYCQSLDERDVTENSFDLIFAFDEIVALGYRESVNLAQIRTFTEMDSHEERVFEAMRKTQEREAKEEMKRRAKELQQAKRDAKRFGGGIGSAGKYGGGFGSSGGGYGGGGAYQPVAETSLEPTSKPTYSQTSRSAGGMKLGKKTKDADSFVDKLVAEGERIVSAKHKPAPAATKGGPPVQQSLVHLKVSERLTVAAGRDGGLQNMEILGMITLKISDGEYGRINIGIKHDEEQRGVQFQTHPNVDKRLFQDKSLIALKGEGKSFPTGQDIGVLKWRLQTTDDSLLPLFINCWPSENAGSCDVNVEYELLHDYLQLNEVVISIPIPSGGGSPVVGEIDGEYHYDTRKHLLDWCIPVIDSSTKSGSLEFSVPGHPDDFFPIKINFGSSSLYCHIEVINIQLADSNKPVNFSSDVSFTPEKFEIV